MMKYLICLLSICFVLPVTAQEKQAGITVEGTPSGMYVALENIAPGTGYAIFRKSGNSDFKKISQYVPCANAKDFYRRQIAWTQDLEDFTPPKKALSDTLWSRYHDRTASFQPFNIVTANLAFGNSFLDTKAVLGETYQYQIIFNDSTSKITSSKKKYELNHPVFADINVYKTWPGDNFIKVEWVTSSIDQAPFFDVYRKQSGGKVDFKKIHPEKGLRNLRSQDSTVFLMIDSTTVEGISYDYFLAAKDYLGNTGNSSDTVRVQVGGRRNVPAVRNFRSVADTSGIMLKWNPVPPNPSLQTLVLLRSTNYDSGYKKLKTLPVSDTVYSDRDVAGGKNYYYQMIVQGAHHFSIPTPRVSGIYTGEVLMMVPQDLKAVSVDNGVKLNWTYHNKEKVTGFKIYRTLSYDKKNKLVGEISDLKDTSDFEFVDSTMTSSKETYYYAVSAVSPTSSLSPLSKWEGATPKEKETIPSPTGLRALWLNDSTVSVTWKDMQRLHSGIPGYRVYKSKKQMKAPSEEQLLVTTDINEFSDTLSPGQESWYWVKAMNRNKSTGAASSPIHVTAPIDKPLPPGDVNGYTQDSEIVLRWDNTLNKEVVKYNVYRAVNTDEVSLIGSVKANKKVLQFMDEKVKPDELYFYYITSINKYGIESNQSQETPIRMD